ncbi:hypothetical protein GCM10010912_59230 [Paenibacillus albidus]|uniref:DUF2313 domain-containing protein n=1 Tax=Paenibacillus albidus TaxID=2041023 RepID=A0A917D086_9BACL|nr:YmfQ family protein [Paenibacillus albidus]GGG06724.1 hypothetical protein GCM10010912_59230 [Paenibacillus albidus]
MQYSDLQYGNGLFADDTSTVDPEAGQPVDLMQYLPLYYQNIMEMTELQKILGIEAGDLKGNLPEIVDQAFLESATWGLGRWESELGLPTDPSKSLVNRREMVKAKMRGTGTTTPEMIQRTASAFSGGDVLVEEVPGEYRFVVRFVGILGIPPNMAGLIQILEEIKPAHLAYEFAYTFTYWESIQSLLWGALRPMTWKELRTYG